MRCYSDAPLGIFDSGVGGLTVVKEILKQLPNESFIYLGDTGRYPYGPRSADIIRRFALQNARFLMGFGIKVLIVACNTASSVALEELRKWISVPIMGVIEPCAREAVKSTKNGRIGVIGTVGTIASNSYQNAIITLNPNIEVFTKVCPLFVPLAEEGLVDGEITELIAHHYLDGFLEKGIDTLVLGCTHYPLLKKAIAKVMGENIKIIDSAKAIVEELKKYLVDEEILSTGDNKYSRFFVTDAPQRFKIIGTKFLAREIEKIELIQIEI
ncbi:glutamate racemase [bacterium]|nr:MAG: glutamate racemase [bacterium]